ncbi:hypothetical protein [Enterococcus sp. DIV0996a]|uniref:hypothetical protein n=1 Tax=Enterococcus sp. DIV0996a TaxID=2774790 RepID=UPI003F26FC67
MKYLIDSYDAYTVGGGLLDKGWQAVNWFFVGVPFFILKLCVSFFLFCESVLNQSDYFIARQTEAYEMSVKILNNFGGTRFGSGTLMGLAIMFSAYYLLVNFFSNRHNFTKVLLHYAAVFLLFFGWFGQVSSTNQNGHVTRQDVPIFIIKSLNGMASSIRSNFLSGTSYESGTDQSSMFDATIQQTFNYVNSGSLDGTMPNGQKLDEKKLLQEPGLSESDKETFLKERDKYIESLEKENPYFAQDGAKTMEKSFAIWVGVINLLVLALPSLYVSVMLTIMQMAINLLILAFPVIALASFFPRCQMLLFKFFKALVGVSFMPVIYGVFLSVLFWMNQLVDQVFLNVAETVNESLLNVLSGGIVLLGTRIIMIVVKIVMIKTLWKNRYRLLRFFSDGQIEQPFFEKQLNEKVKEGAERVTEVGVGTAQVAAGAYTGNAGMVMSGADALLPDKALNVGKEHFVDETGQFTGIKQGLRSFFNPEMEEDSAPEESFDIEEKEQDVDEVTPEIEAVFEEVSEEEQIDNSLEDTLPELEGEETDFDNSLSESDEWIADETVVSEPPENTEADLEIEPIVENTESESVEQENSLELETMSDTDNSSVTIDNFDELQFEKEEKAYFDHEQDQEFIANYSENNTNNRYEQNTEVIDSSEQNFTSLEQNDDQFFGAEEEQEEEIEDWL